jgi:hypothetical protein
MWDSQKGTVLFTPFKKIKEKYLHKGKIARFFLQGTHGRYELLKDGRFIFPTLKKPVSIIINNYHTTITDIFPYTKYLIQATAFQGKEVKQPDGSILCESKHRVDYVGLGWRRELQVHDKDGTTFPVDLSVTLMVRGKENGLHFVAIASDVENEKLIYPTSLKINQDKDIEIEVRRGNNE